MTYRIRPLIGCYQVECRTRFGLWRSTGIVCPDRLNAEVRSRMLAWKNNA